MRFIRRRSNHPSADEELASKESDLLAKRLRTAYGQTPVPPELLAKIGSAVHAAGPESRRARFGTSGWTTAPALGIATVLIIVAGVQIAHGLGTSKHGPPAHTGSQAAALTLQAAAYVPSSATGNGAQVNVEYRLSAIGKSAAAQKSGDADARSIGMPKVYMGKMRLHAVRCSTYLRAPGLGWITNLCFRLKRPVLEAGHLHMRFDGPTVRYSALSDTGVTGPGTLQDVRGKSLPHRGHVILTRVRYLGRLPTSGKVHGCSPAASCRLIPVRIRIDPIIFEKPSKKGMSPLVPVGKLGNPG